jgi:hypothetical protein
VPAKLSSGRFRGSALARWLLAVPWVLASAAVVWLLAGTVLDSIGVVLVFVAWLASGALTLWPPLENFLARVILRFRSLTGTEQAVVETAWAAVTDRAGHRADQFQLWISEACGSARLTSLMLRLMPVARSQRPVGHSSSPSRRWRQCLPMSWLTILAGIPPCRC